MRSAARLRAQSTGRQLAYVVVGLPLGAAYLVLMSVATIATPLGFVWIGVPVLLVAERLAWRCAVLERTLANRLLEARIPPLAPPPRDPRERAWRGLRGRMRRARFWRSAALLTFKLPTTGLAAGIIGAGLALAGGLLVLGGLGLAGSNHGYVGPVALGVPLGVALCLLAVPVVVVTVAVADGLTGALRALARVLLATRIPAGGPVREMLAQSLGDRTLSIAYWLADRRMFVDERGSPVLLPAAGSNRAWTAVEYEGRRVAAIIHDANLDASAELVQAAAAAASLAIDNDRLKADLRARVQELRASRMRLVEAGDAARRRLERDLHDGAQQQLVSLALDLKTLRSRIASNPRATELIDRIDERLSDALAELRELARGIHPAILTDRGLEPALNALAQRAPLPVRLDSNLAGRPPAPVEAAAYFVCAEALTNIVKYARASRATIRAFADGGEIVVEVRDDGVGGADDRQGSGLRGLHDRVGALDGTITVSSPPGAGTVVRARIPSGAGELVAQATAHPRERRGSSG